MRSGSSLPGEAAKSKCKRRLQLVEKRDHIQIRGFYFKLRTGLPGTNKTKVKKKRFLLTFPLSSPLGCYRKGREALPPLALVVWCFLWQQNRGFAVLSSLQTWPDSFPEDLQIFDHNKQSYILMDSIFFPLQKWLWFIGSKFWVRVPLHYLNPVVESGTESLWF